MAPWVLIMTLLGTHSVSVTSLEFPTERTCLDAGLKWAADVRDNANRSWVPASGSTVCVSR